MANVNHASHPALLYPHQYMRQHAEEHTHMLHDLVEWEQTMKERDDTILQTQSREIDDVDTMEVTSDAEALHKKPKVFIEKSSGITESNINDTLRPTMVQNDSEIEYSLSTATRTTTTTTTTTTTETTESMEQKERQRGNEYYKAGKYQDALKCYTQCLGINSKSVLAFSNRSMTQLKLKDWINAEADANEALRLDSTHVKSYQRRSVARLHLGKLRAALCDIQMALDVVDPTRHPKDTSVHKSLLVEEQRIRQALMKAIHEAPKRKLQVSILNHSHVHQNPNCQDSSANATSPQEAKATPPSDHNTQQHLELVQTSPPQSAHSPLVSSSFSHYKEPENKKSAKKRTKTPTTWYEFQTMWKSCPHDTDRLQFMTRIRPSKLGKLFKNGIEDVHLMVSIIVVLSHMEKDAADYLHALSTIQKLDLSVMMMTEKQHNIVREAIHTIFAKDDGGYDVEHLAKKFGC